MMYFSEMKYKIEIYRKLRIRRDIIFILSIFMHCTLHLVYQFLACLFDESEFCLFILQTAIPVIIGTKFDDFIQLPIDLQWTIASQVMNFCHDLINYSCAKSIYEVKIPRACSSIGITSST